MHHGYIVSTAGLPATLEALNRHQPLLVLRDRRGSIKTLDLGGEENGWRMAAAERADRAYILDTSFVLSSAFDALLAVSAELDALVVGCGAETTSGSYWFGAMDRGHLIRAYWNGYSDMREPWSKGQPLACESEQPLEDLDGEGLTAALASLGFDGSWSDGDDLRELFYDFQVEAPGGGPLDEELSAFRKAVEIPPHLQPQPRVLQRGGGYDLSVRDPRAPEQQPKKRGIFGFLRRG